MHNGKTDCNCPRGQIKGRTMIENPETGPTEPKSIRRSKRLHLKILQPHATGPVIRSKSKIPTRPHHE